MPDSIVSAGSVPRTPSVPGRKHRPRVEGRPRAPANSLEGEPQARTCISKFEMIPSRRAVVIGGGPIGVCSAYYLSLAGWQVTLADRGEIGRGCSYGNACLIVPSHSHPLPAPGVFGQALRWMGRRDSPFCIRPRLDLGLLRWTWQFRRYCTPEAARRGFDALLRLSRASLQLYEELARSAAFDFFFRRQGLLHVYVSDAGFAGAPREQEELEDAGFRTRLMSGEEAREFEPALGDRLRGALFIEGEAHADSYGFVRALAAACEKRGTRVLERRALVSIHAPAGRVRSVVVEPASRAEAVPGLIAERHVIITPLGDRVRFGGTLELAGGLSPSVAIEAFCLDRFA